jgi:hypothetical protein
MADAGSVEVGVHVRFELMVGGHLVVLAAFFVEADPPAFALGKKSSTFIESALIVAPTATEKSFIGREVVRSALERGKPGPHAYLVPFRSLANEVYEGFQDLLGSTNVRLRISNGDYREPIRPEESDLIVSQRSSGVGRKASRYRPERCFSPQSGETLA